MGLAPFFSKTARSASQILAGFDSDAFVERLVAFPIGIAWDSEAVTGEGKATLELTVDLLARLFPEIRLEPLDSSATSALPAAETRARSINPNIGLASSSTDARVVVVIGRTDVNLPSTPERLLYCGSSGWDAALSTTRPMGSGNSDNPFGAGAAACLAAAAVFRFVFRNQLEVTSEDEHEFRLSLLSFSVANGKAITGESSSRTLSPASIDLGEVHLVGVGAVGHGFVWALRRVPWLKGILFVIDGEEYDSSNPQRYVETTASQSGFKAAAAAARSWASASLRIEAADVDWATHLTRLTTDRQSWLLDRVALAVDNPSDRIMAQAALPRSIYNAWTRRENLGISRHDFLNGPCVCCLYEPQGQRPNWDEQLAQSLGMKDPEDIKRVRAYLDTGTPLDDEALAWIGDRMRLAEGQRLRLSEFRGKSIDALYSEGVCGGFLMPGEAGAAAPAEVPMAFQSAMAGICLAAELVVDAGELRDQTLPAITELNLLRSMPRRLNSPQLPTAGCAICQDSDFRSTYREKYIDKADSTPKAEHSETALT